MHVEVPPCYEDTRRRRYTYLLGIEYQYIMTMNTLLYDNDTTKTIIIYWNKVFLQTSLKTCFRIFYTVYEIIYLYNITYLLI